MAERSWFFNAEQTGEDEYDRVYLAEDFAKYFSLFISNGVFPNPSTGLQVLAQEVPNMTVTLKPGFAFINGYGYENTSDYKFTIDTADGVLNREDSIFIRWYLTDRKIAAYKAVGTPGAEASHVDLIRTEDYWDLCVARILVEAGVTSITQSAITDTRLNTDLCGIVATLVDQVDTTTLYNQIQADLEEFQNVSEEDFTEWYNQQQQMFTTWYQKQQSDFDEWFDDINSKLGTEPATALQQQIDEINTSIEENSDRMFSTYRHVKNGTTHTFIGSGSNGKVKMTADVANGDTVTLNSQPVPAYMGTEDFVDALAGEDVAGKWLTFTNDGTQLNFKGGGGLSSSKLAAANTAPGDVRTGKKFYAGDKTIKTGTLPVLRMGESHKIGRWQNSETKEVFIQANTIPEGIYESDGNTWSPQINIPAELFGNAAASQVLAGVTFTSENGAKIPGTMPNQGAKTAALNAGGAYTIPQGWHNGSGKVTANSLASQTDANAAAGNILTGKTAWVKGSKITGTMANRGAPNQTLGIGGSYSLSAGYYSGGKISAKGSFSGSGSNNGNGETVQIHRDQNNVVATGYTHVDVSASISGRTVTVVATAYFHIDQNGNTSVPDGNLSIVVRQFTFTID